MCHSPMHRLRIHAMGSSVIILSPVDREEFVRNMCEEINKHGADPNWLGWFNFPVSPRKDSKGDKEVSIRIRSVDLVEEV